ncbi:MAG: cell wall-binding repeat-containing protein [Solirubrobacteraceae bacterium]
MRGPSLRVAVVATALCATLAGCGKSLPHAAVEPGSGSTGTLSAHGAASASTVNTTRLGGSNPTIDAAAIAVAEYPGLTPATRPRAVVLVSSDDWPAALAASVLAGAPLHAPLLYSEGSTLPEASSRALRAMEPTGTGSSGGSALRGLPDGVQAIEVGQTAKPSGYHALAVAANRPAVGSAAMAVSIERLVSVLRGHRPRRVIVTADDGPPAMTMPAAGLSAETGAPILYVDRSGIPRATRIELARLGRGISMYVVGSSSVVGERVRSELERFGAVTRIAGSTPASNAIAVARFTDGSFGWGVLEPGHGLVFANAARPLDGPAAAPLSASGDYGPLLLLESSSRLGSALGGYLSDLQPGSPPSGPVHGVYNHGWLIGDESAISATTQARLDTILGISSRPSQEPEVASPTTSSSELTPPNEP